MIRKLLFSGLLALALVFVAACGGGTPAASTSAGATPAGGAESKPAASKPAGETAVTEAPEPTGAPAATPADETRDVQDINGSLDALKSYRLRFNFTFDGKDEQGKPQKGGMEWVQEAIKESKDQHIRFASTGDTGHENGKGGAFELYRVDGMTYMYSPDGQSDQKCVGMGSSQNDQDTGTFFKPSDIVGGLKQARLAGKGETVNDVVSDHYTFDQNAISFATFASAKGDVWLAQDGGFLVKYVGTATGKENILSGKAAEGTFTWEYNVEDANKVASIELPKECAGQKPAGDIPMPENAADKSSFGKMQTFKSPDAPADVAAFYKKAMAGQGWTAGDANAMGELQTLEFTKDGRKLTITITKEEGGSSVLINEEQGS